MKNILLFLMLATIHISAYPQAGNLDLSFAKKGFVRTNFEADDKYYYGNSCGGMLFQPNGSFYLVVEMNQQTFITRRLADSKLDSSYGENGYSIPVFMTHPRAVMQPDGKILLGGTVALPGHQDDFGLARFTANGLLDSSFANEGLQTTDFSDWRDNISGMVLQADGKIIAAGTSSNNGPEKIAIACYLPDGSPDNSFSADGKLTTIITGYDRAYGLGLQPDGKFVVTGTSYNYSTLVNNMTVLRYLPDGTPDNTFSGDGVQLISAGLDCWGGPLSIQSDGKLLVGGASRFSASQGILVRLLADGSLDLSFSGDGMLFTNYGTSEANNYGVAIQPDDKIIVTGGAKVNGYPEFAIARYNPDGSPDFSFSGDGLDIPNVRNDLPYSDGASSFILFTPGNEILIAGTYHSNQAFAVVKYRADGKLDASFGDHGILRDHKRGWHASYKASALQPDGRIVTAGTAGPPYQPSKFFLVARYNKDGSPDDTFSEDGKLMSDFGFINGGADAVAIQADGKILLAGTASNGKDQDFALVRLNADGTLDNSFSDDGQLLTDITGYNEEAKAILLQPDGKIVVGGFANIWNLDYDFAVVRYNPDGSLDHSFSMDGMLTTNLFTARDFLSSMILQPDGKIIAVGIANQDIGITRYNTDGSLDLSFDKDGIVITDVSGIGDQAYAAVWQPDHKIVVAGGTASDFLFIRYNNDGSMDESFSEDGKFIVDLGTNNEYATSILIQPGGELIAGGVSPSYFHADFALMRIRPNGTADSTFSGDGKLVMDFGYGEDVLESILIQGSRLYATGSTAYGGMMPLIAAYQLDASNIPPIAGAWLQKYYNPTTALLAAWGSQDPDGGPITYWWEKTAGPAGSGILYANSASPVVTGLVDGTYSFQLTVTDNQQATGTASVSFTVSTNLPPIAGAWFQKYYSPTSALLAAWGSYDPEGGPIKYAWEKTDGPGGTTLLYGNSASPVVNGLTNGVYTYRLTVTDDHGATGVKELTFAVNNPPLAGNRAGQLLPEDLANKSGQFIIYHNPVINLLTFKWNSDYTGDATLSIVDVSGRKVQALQIRKSGAGYYGNMEVTHLKAGQYYLYLANGKEKIMSMPFVKQ